MKDYTKSERCYWMTASLYSKYNTFSDRESEQQHRTMTFAELPNHPHLLTMVEHLHELTDRRYVVCFRTLARSEDDGTGYEVDPAHSLNYCFFLLRF